MTGGGWNTDDIKTDDKLHHMQSDDDDDIDLWGLMTTVMDVTHDESLHEMDVTHDST